MQFWYDMTCGPLSFDLHLDFMDLSHVYCRQFVPSALYSELQCSETGDLH